MTRDWTLARAKCDAEGRCRVCQRRTTQAAHVLGRSHDQPGPDGVVVVAAVDVVPLCREHHHAYDERRLDLLPYLSLAEQAAAAGHVGIVRALARTTSLRDPPTGGLP